MRVEKIPDDAVLIPGTKDEYVDPRGNIYGYDHRNRHPCLPYRKELKVVCGYLYAPINYSTCRITKRVHRIVAEAFIPNPDNLPIVMHLDNDKKNNHVDNLKWGTISENTKQAFEDGLARNSKGFEDSQSYPCDMYDTASNRFLSTFGSTLEAAQQTGICASTIARQIKHPQRPVRKSLYFTHMDEGPRDHDIIVAFDFDTDTIIGQYPNCSKAAIETGVPTNVVNAQVNLGRKPNWTKNNVYFKRMYLKGEEVIEIQRESRVGCV